MINQTKWCTGQGPEGSGERKSVSDRVEMGHSLGVWTPSPTLFHGFL